ncbi:MAG: hypothetical protein KatS3mg119_1061 [Rhodothalassiaceae bacterium]|nr:MAG: hypothetical protein KatS3mg119_1061 [Rhodothalassiaceae bacterium]
MRVRRRTGLAGAGRRPKEDKPRRGATEGL